MPWICKNLHRQSATVTADVDAAVAVAVAAAVAVVKCNASLRPLGYPSENS